MRQTVTLFRSRYEGSNPSHLKKLWEQRENNERKNTRESKGEEKGEDCGERREARISKSNSTKETKKAKPSTVCERSTEKTGENLGRRTAKGIWIGASKSKRSMSSMWEKTKCKGRKRGTRALPIDGSMEKGECEMFIG